MAFDAVSGPPCYIGTEGRPDEFGCDSLPGSVNARVTETVEHVENLATHGLRHKGPCWTVGDIDEKRGAPELHLAERKACLCFCRNPLKVRVERLEVRHCFEVDVEPIYGVDYMP